MIQEYYNMYPLSGIRIWKGKWFTNGESTHIRKVDIHPRNSFTPRYASSNEFTVARCESVHFYLFDGWGAIFSVQHIIGSKKADRILLKPMDQGIRGMILAATNI